jgi:mono/diheme cytochrome c family protein
MKMIKGLGWRWAALVSIWGPVVSAVDGPSAADLEFFESKVRPVLAEHCFKCHSAKENKTKGGLAMDSRELILKGGDTGPALVPGQPDKSLLIRAVRHETAELAMPPKDPQLSQDKIAALAEWVRRGAPDPRTGGPAPAAHLDIAKARAHWAFQPVKRPDLRGPGATDIDRLLGEAQRAQGLGVAARADARTQVRRLAYDLTGLPPSPEMVEAFEKTPTDDAYARLVDDLLASPRFGEKWARYWLDVARYADTRGVPVPITADARFLYSYAYRDYVIGAYNEDKPFDRFILEQIAADRLPDAGREVLPALGFLTLGRTFLNNNNDIIDDRIDVVTRGLLGLTVACARCHDHKFDPVPTKDYYSLYGVFNSSEVPTEPEIIREREDNPDRADYLAKRAEKMVAVEKGLLEEARSLNRTIREKTGKYLWAVEELRKGAPANMDTFIGERGLVLLPLEKWRKKVDGLPTSDAVLGFWKAALALTERGVKEGEDLVSLLRNHPESGKWNALVQSALSKEKVTGLPALAELFGRLVMEVDGKWKTALGAAEKAGKSAPERLVEDDAEVIRSWMDEEAGPMNLTQVEVEQAFSRKYREKKQKLMEVVQVLEGTHPGAPDRAIVLRDRAKPSEPVVFIRGNPGNRGPAIPRRFLEVLVEGDRPVWKDGSGRLELAQSIAHPSNPLTARVYVNRVWGQLFGKPLVSTPGDFGVRTSPPAVPGLLELLASDFMEKGWSSKALIRRIVLSDAYRQSSDPVAVAEEKDPENAFVHRQNRRRLTFEAMRDTLVAAGGELDFRMGGRPELLTKAPYPLRRAVYAFVDRQDVPSVLRAFDFASPDTSTPERFQTTVPQQALYLMNNDFIAERARALASRLPETTEDARIRSLFRTLFQRAPKLEEMALLRAYIALPPHEAPAPKAPGLNRWESLCQALLLANETVYLD